MRTPNETHRLLLSLTVRARANQAFFADIDKNEYGKTVAVGNANYAVQQSQDWLKTEELVAASEDLVYLAHAKSDMSRVLAILHRQATARGWDVLELLAEGVEYEEAVVEDITQGRRPARSHKVLGEARAADSVRQPSTNDRADQPASRPGRSAEEAAVNTELAGPSAAS